MTENEMVGWHHRLDGLEFGWTPGVGDGQGGLAPNLPLGLRGKAGGGARVTAGPKRPHLRVQHTMPPCPSLTPGVHPNPCPLSR